MTATASPKSAAPLDNRTTDLDDGDNTIQPSLQTYSDTLDTAPQPGTDTIIETAQNSHTKSIKLEINGHGNEEIAATEVDNSHGEDADGPPSKRRRVRDTTPHSTPRRPKPVSPPWKKIEAEGPTTFSDNGRRRSGRVNVVPIELQPPSAKRVTRGALHGKQGSPNSRDKRDGINGHVNGTHKNASASTGRANASKAVSTPVKPPPKKASATVPPKTLPRTRRHSPSPLPLPPASSPPRPRGTRHSSRIHRQHVDTPKPDQPPQQNSDARPTRIRLRLKPPTIPLVHPAQVNVLPSQKLARPKIGQDFNDYVQKAPTIDVKDGGWLDPDEEGGFYTDDQAKKEAEVITRIDVEVQPGGLLSEERCSLFVPEPAEEPSRQWAHMDHLVKQMANFRRLMLMEQQRHKGTAKRMAEACRDEWIRRQPKTAEQIEAEVRLKWMACYKTVIRALMGTWENIRTEVNRRRLEEWEAEEQRRVKAALNEAVNMSELKLQARRARFDAEALSDEDEDLDEDEERDLYDSDEDADEDDDGAVDEVATIGSRDSEPGDGFDEDENNMSSSGEEEDVRSIVSDEGLTQDQLREKYANVPDIPVSTTLENGLNGASGEAYAEVEDQGETTDESIDMDDDLGSTDDEMRSDNEEMSASQAGDSDGDDQPGLLGLFFGKQELQGLKGEIEVDEAAKSENSVDMVDAPGPIVDAPICIPKEDSALSVIDKQTLRKDYAVQGLNGSPGIHSEHLASTDALDSAPSNADPRPPDPFMAAVASPSDPLRANDPNVPAKVPGPLQPQDVEMQIVDVVEQVREHAAEASSSASTQQAPALSRVEITSATSDQPQTSPDTDALTNSSSRDRSQSPRTSDTKPSEIDTTSSLVKSIVSRSTSPQSHVPQTELPFLLRGTLREYQHYGLDWLAGLYRNHTNGILADEMGLGKTIQTIALLAHLACHHEVWGPHLVIVPTSVMLNWEMEFKKWCPGFKVLSYYGSIEERKRKRQGWKTDDMWNVCVTSYQIVLADHQVFRRRQWHYMILDEAHNIKNFKSKRWQTLLGFNTQARLLLTGTPLQNNLTELWSLLFFLMPSENGVGGFADLAEFQDWFHKPESQILESGREQMDDEARAIIAKLHKVLRPYLLRRLKADVEKQMPAKYEHVEFCRLSRRQRELYDGFLARTDTREALASGNYISVINCLMQLRKVCNHPDLFVERPIMTSFRQSKSVIADYATTEGLIRGKLLAENPMSHVSLGFLNLIPTQYEGASKTACERVSQLSSRGTLLELRDIQRVRAQSAYRNLDPSTIESNVVYLESTARWGRFEELQHCIYLNALRSLQHPIYGKRLTDFLTLGVNERPFKARPKVPQKVMSWFAEDLPTLKSMVLTLDQRAATMTSTISKFACVTPAVVTRDLDQFILGSRAVQAFDDTNLRLCTPVRHAPFMPKEAPLDPWHESRMKLSIQFPDRRLLQYDCGKLQALDRLLRKLQTGNHRALIFTQMTKVLDILEQFLNIHGHKYLRLDGATKVEQRQILTDRFNHDQRILCFILSTRSGGLGINLTGADTVIFYDQDWNPAMDKQCQDRCHRIGQTRDVHIYRLVSEHTIEANILRKASQKQMLDDVVIQEGGFTTDYFNKLSVRDVIGGATHEGDVVGDAMDRVLGGVENSDQRTVGHVLEQAEDREDVDAARVAEKEIQEDEADFEEKPVTANPSGTSSARQGTPTAHAALGKSNLGLFSETADADGILLEIENNAWGEPVHSVDDFMLASMGRELEGTTLELPKDKKKGKSKKGKDTRKR